jgi:hypothetical protein
MKYISVPTSLEAMQRLDFDECIDGDLLELTISDEQFNCLLGTGLISELNNSIGVNIDEFEDEKITDINKLTIAKTIAEKACATKSDQISQLVLSQIDKAIALKTGVFFFF